MTATKYNFDIAKVLSGVPLEYCATLRWAKGSPEDFSTFDKVRYQRAAGGELVRGFVSSSSYTAVHIYDSKTGALVAAPRNRVHKY
jgi:hypothetical protein